MLHKILSLLQFIPLTIFLLLAKKYDMTGEAWSIAFQWGAVVAFLQLAILLPILKEKCHRLICGANLFLIFGGIAFYCNYQGLLTILNDARESLLFGCVAIICVLSIAFFKTGVFEIQYVNQQQQKRFSYIFLCLVIGAFIWSFWYRGDALWAGTMPFIVLLMSKRYLERRLTLESLEETRP
jgi:hypothetical protein